MRRSLVLAAAAALFLSGCATQPTTAFRARLNGLIAAQNYSGALDYIKSHKESQYGPRSEVLYKLDEGTVLHHGGHYRQSDRDFADAEHMIEDLYTKSVTKEAGTLVLNDTTVDYSGAPFERVLLHVFRAMNWVFLGRPHEAAVEANKAEFFLQGLNDKFGDKLGYKDDAFVRYLDAMLYADIGNLNDARISLEAAKRAYGWYASRYNTPEPRFDFPDDYRKMGDGELVFIHYNGVAPRKVSKTVQVAWNQAALTLRHSEDTSKDSARAKNALVAGFMGNAITVAYPEYVQDPYSIVSSEVFIDSRPVAHTVLMEDIGSIAFKNLQDRMPLIMTRAIARAAVKYILARTAAKAAGKACDREFGRGSLGSLFCSGISGGIASGAAAATEVADTRSWETLPSQIRMARIKLPPGTYFVRVDFKNAAGFVVSTAEFPNVAIHKNERRYIAYRTAL